MELKPIPNNTVVHTPTEAEAKELLVILHENGYKWHDTHPLTMFKYAYGPLTAYVLSDMRVGYAKVEGLKEQLFDIIPFSQFKKKYCEEDKPQPKFTVGDKVIIIGHSEYAPNIGVIAELHGMPISDKYPVDFGDFYEWIDKNFLRPYTESETKPTENIEAKDEKSEIPINLCEQLKGHEGEPFYSPCYGVVELTAITPRIEIQGVKKHSLTPKGSHHSISDGQCMLFPSRALYEQYPLDAKKAWKVWQEEQKIKCRIWLSVETKAKGKVDVKGWEPAFDSTADREKAIEEIKAIIEKYSKK